VLIPNKKRRPGIRRVPFTKTKKALVRALPRHDLLEHQAKVFRLVAIELDVYRFAVGLFYLESKIGLARGLEAKIKIITHRSTVDADNTVVWLEFEFLRQA